MFTTMKDIEKRKNEISFFVNESISIANSLYGKWNRRVSKLIFALSKLVFIADYDACQKIIAKLPPSLVKRKSPFFYPMYQELRRKVDQRKRSKYKRRITNKLIHLVQQHRADDAIDLVLDNRYDLEPVIVQSVLALKGEQQ